MNTNLFLILCGSSMSFMENQVLGCASPLYGRRTGQLKVEPFDYADSSLFFSRYTLENRLTAYGAVCGIPQYLQYLSQEDDLLTGLGRSYFKPTGHLFEEPSSLLKQGLREPAAYNTIITAIASGAGRLNEIATKTGEDSKKCAKHLKTMLDLRILKKEIPIGAKRERNSLRLTRLVDGGGIIPRLSGKRRSISLRGQAIPPYSESASGEQTQWAEMRWTA